MQYTPAAIRFLVRSALPQVDFCSPAVEDCSPARLLQQEAPQGAHLEEGAVPWLSDGCLIYVLRIFKYSF
jgi:hypothetical protein